MSLPQVGLHHPEVRRVLSIQRNSAPNPHRLLVAEGVWAHDIVLRSGAPVRSFFWCPEALFTPEAKQRAEALLQRAERSYRISRKVLLRISERDDPDGLISLVSLPQWDSIRHPLDTAGLIMVADSIEIPGNLGTLIRTLDAARVDALLVTHRRTRLTHPKVFRASQGTVLTFPVLEFDSADEALDWLLARHFRVFLADTRNAAIYRSIDYTRGRTAFVVGSERYGIHPDWYAHELERVYVPMLGSSDSLNVSVAAAVLVFEARSQLNQWALG